MFDNIETFLALAKKGKMGAAATHLRISQSAVSKRIAALELELNRELIEKEGRNVRLTAYGEQFATRITPLLTEWKTILLEETYLNVRKMVVGISESIMCSWGAPMFFNLTEELPDWQLMLHTHRSGRVLDLVESGDFHFGISVGLHRMFQGLILEKIWEEPLVIIPAGLKPVNFFELDPIPIITLDKSSGTRNYLETKAKTTIDLEPVMEIESYMAVAQLAIAGFGHGLVPFGIAESLNVPANLLFPIFRYGYRRPIQIITRKNMLVERGLNDFLSKLETQIVREDKRIENVFNDVP